MCGSRVGVWLNVNGQCRWLSGIVAVAICLAVGGCQSRPPRIASPKWSPQRIADRAIELLDANGDSAVDIDESEASPGLAAGFKHIDQDKDGRLTHTEIEERIAVYEKIGTGLQSQSFQLVLNGRPLSHAQVRFVPDEFLGELIEPASGRTDRSGVVRPRAEGQDVPAMRIGFYRVEVYPPESPDDKPLKLNPAVGVEVSPVSDGEETPGSNVLHLKVG